MMDKTNCTVKNPFSLLKIRIKHLIVNLTIDHNITGVDILTFCYTFSKIIANCNVKVFEINM